MAQYLYIDNRDGFGVRDFTNFLMEAGQFINQTKNEPTVFQFMIAEVAGVPNWTLPSRGAFVRFVDTKFLSRYTRLEEGVVFTGYIVDDPDFTLLGKGHDGEPKWGFRVNCTSEDYLAQQKKLPPRTYINKTHGYILKDILRIMFEDTTIVFNTDGICDGATEQLYQVDTNKKWAELLSDFSSTDGFSYWTLDGYMYYGPEAPISPSLADSSEQVVIDEEDERYNPYNLNLEKISREIANDVTVVGLDEPTDVIRDEFISDGFQGFHPLTFEPFGVEESILIDDDFTGDDIDDSNWLEADEVEDYIQAFEGALNVIGGLDDGSVYLLHRRAIDLAGIIEFRDGEVYFPPVTGGSGVIGGLYTSDTLTTANLWTGWYLDSANLTLAPMTADGVQGTSMALVATRSYVLRRRVKIDSPAAAPRSYTYNATGLEIGAESSQRALTKATVTWTVDEIVNDDPARVFLVRKDILTMEFSEPPPFALYAAIVPEDGCKVIMNHVLISRPSQVEVLVNGRQTRVGSYIDGGRCAVQSQNKRATLNWYSVPGENLSYDAALLADGPKAYWTLDEEEGNFRDESGIGTGTIVEGATTVVSPGIRGAQMLTYITVNSGGDPTYTAFFNTLQQYTPVGPALPGYVWHHYGSGWEIAQVVVDGQTPSTGVDNNNYLTPSTGTMVTSTPTVGVITLPQSLNDGLAGWSATPTFSDPYASLPSYIAAGISGVWTGRTWLPPTHPAALPYIPYQSIVVETTPTVVSGGGSGFTRFQASGLGSGVGSSVYYDGTVGKLSSRTPIEFATNCSIEFWIKPDSGSDASGRPIISNRTALLNRLRIAVVSSKLQITDSGVTHTSTRSVDDGVWHHCVWTCNGSTSKIYIDKALDSSQAFARTGLTATAYVAWDERSGRSYKGLIDEVSVYNKVLTPERVAEHFLRGSSLSSEIVTIPRKGSRVSVTYYRNEKARARVRNQTSIDVERERFRDDGIRQTTLRSDTLVPPPRTSEECLYIAQAYIYDNSRTRYQGSYYVQTLFDTVLALARWPMPGDKIWCSIELPNYERLEDWLIIQRVQSQFLGETGYGFTIEFGPVNRLEIIKRQLFFRRKTTLDDPTIATDDIDIIEDLYENFGIPTRPPSPTSVEVLNIVENVATIGMAVNQSAGTSYPIVGYEIRTSDSGWGQPNYIAQVEATTADSGEIQVVFNVNISRPDQRTFIRPYNALGEYSRNSAVVRIAKPSI